MFYLNSKILMGLNCQGPSWPTWTRKYAINMVQTVERRCNNSVPHRPRWREVAMAVRCHTSRGRSFSENCRRTNTSHTAACLSWRIMLVCARVHPSMDTSYVGVCVCERCYNGGHCWSIRRDWTICVDCKGWNDKHTAYDDSWLVPGYFYSTL